MSILRPANSHLPGTPSLGDLLEARPRGLTEPETWALLYQAVQALQDLFLSDGASEGFRVPLITPSTLLMSSKGRVRLSHRLGEATARPLPHLTTYLAPEYRPSRHCSDTDIEKMWIFGLGETLKRATMIGSSSSSAIYCGDLYHVLSAMTMPHAASRASLMYLLDVIAEYCKRRQQNRPFSHIVMDLHEEAMASLEATLPNTWGPPAMPELRPRAGNRTESSTNTLSIPRRWMGITRSQPLEKIKLTREASTSMEDLSGGYETIPVSSQRPNSMCLSNEEYVDMNLLSSDPTAFRLCATQSKKTRVRRNPVQRAASRLYRAGSEHKVTGNVERDCVGPEFVVRASLPSKQINFDDSKGSVRKLVTVIMLNGQKIDITCNPNTTTAGKLFELIIHKEHIEENFILGLSALIAGDFVFLPSDARICKAIISGSAQGSALTLFLRVRFFLPSLRGVRGLQARHLIYLQLRRSVLEHQLPCSCTDLVELGGLALQAEFGDYNLKEHGTRDYFLLEHYVPETITSAVIDPSSLRKALTKAHMSRKSLDNEKAEEDFILLAQTLPHYGGHFYTAIWVMKDNVQKDVWLCISAQGINLYDRGSTAHNGGPIVCESFEWRSIQTLCYSKHYLCILPHAGKVQPSVKLKKYKLKMDNKKSYFAFRLASLHHQFFLRLRTEYISLQSLSQQFGIPLKVMKNETNCIYKMETLSNHFNSNQNNGSVNAETEFKIEFRTSTRSSIRLNKDTKCKRSKSVNNLAMDAMPIEEYQNKENENPAKTFGNNGLILDSSCLSGYPNSSIWDKRRGVKMGVRAFGRRFSRSMEAVNLLSNDDLEQLSLQSVSLTCSSNSISKTPGAEAPNQSAAYILDASIKSTDEKFLPNLQETLSESLIEKLNNFSFMEERLLKNVIVHRDSNGSLGMQITEGSDGNVYVQSVVIGGPAHIVGNIIRGDQIVAVDGKNLLQCKYLNALEMLKNTGNTVEFVLASSNECSAPIDVVKNKSRAKINLSDINENHLKNFRLETTMNKIKHLSSPTATSAYKTDYLPMQKANVVYNYKNIEKEKQPHLEKHFTESCIDDSNPFKKNANIRNLEVPYHKHIRYDAELEGDAEYMDMGERSLCSKSNISETKATPQKKAVVVNMIPKSNVDDSDLVQSSTNLNSKDENRLFDVPHIALPRSLGLGRKWRGPVKYPVTPVKHNINALETDNKGNSNSYVTTSDKEQIFI